MSFFFKINKACMSNPCFSGSTCIENNSTLNADSYTCLCPTGLLICVEKNVSILFIIILTLKVISESTVKR